MILLNVIRKGMAINGKIQKVSALELVGGDISLDGVIEDVVTGIPASQLDHGINNMIFGNHGEILVQVSLFNAKTISFAN